MVTLLFGPGTKKVLRFKKKIILCVKIRTLSNRTDVREIHAELKPVVPTFL